MRVGRRDDAIHGEFEVIRVEAYDLEAGVRTDTVTGRLLHDGRPGQVVSVRHTGPSTTAPLAAGTRLPASWRADRPQRARVEFPQRGIRGEGARIERDRRAAALGIDPATLTADPVPPGSTPVQALLMWERNGQLLPDGTRPVEVAEAERLTRHGRATDAVIVAIEQLKTFPGTVPRGASVANVALDVAGPDGGSYRVLARFGFRTEERRRQIGFAGARVPVRVDPLDPTRVTLDPARLPAA